MRILWEQNSGLIPLMSESFQAMARLWDLRIVIRAVFSSTLKSFAMMTGKLPKEVYPPLGRDTVDSNQMKWVHLWPQEMHRPLPEGNRCFRMELGSKKSTMDMTIDQQVELDEALVPHAIRLRIGKSNFRLRSDITSKESTLQYDVLRLTHFYKAFLVTADVFEIYMQEFWENATVHHHSIRFKMNNKKRIVNLEGDAAYMSKTP
nr:hypothetical protein [Tanacetum cinerariifolium]